MAEAPSISPKPPAKASLNYAELRKAAQAEIQDLAATTWTDHNAHDPGVTVMEAFCYAMTELGLRTDLEVADLIASGQRREPARLPAPQRVFPCAPVTADDLRSVLLDHYLVGDAWISPGVADLLAYFEDPTSNPPLTYATGTPRITPRGLYDVLLAFEDADLNGNTYAFAAVVGPDTFNVEFALPHWDEPEAQPFRAGGITLNTVTMLNVGAEWRALDEPLAFFGEASIAYSGPGGNAVQATWVLLRVNDELDQAAAIVPGILAAAQTLVESTAANGLIDRFVQRVSAADESVATVSRYLLTWRNLAEFPVRLAVSRVQEVAVHARIETAGTTGLEDLLADIFFELDCRLSPPALFSDLETTSEDSADAVFDGPLLTHGVLANAADEALLRDDRIFLSDVLRLIMKRRAAVVPISQQENPSGRDVVAVTDLALSNFINNRIITSRATECLRLVDVARHRPRLSLAKSRIVVVRDDVEIAYDLGRVTTRYETLRAEKRAEARLADFDVEWSPTAGEDLPIDDYYPFQNDLPAIYGVTESGLPGNASITRRQQALQMRAYLLLFEQFLADGTEQLVNVNRFFSPSGDETTSYFTRPLLELPDMDKLVRSFTSGSWTAFLADPDNPYADALRRAAEDEDTALDRRNRMLDHLLARHGEDAVTWGQELHRWGQKSLLRTTVNIPALPQRIAVRRRRVNRRLLRSKADFLQVVPELHAMRLIALGDPTFWVSDLVAIERTGAQFTWRIMRNGAAVFEGAIPSATRGEALARARDVVQLATTPSYYDAVNLGGPVNRRYVLRDGSTSTDPILATGTVGFPNLAAATAAGTAVRNDLTALRVLESSTAMERRSAHLVGIRHPGRRRLRTPVGSFFEVFNSAGPASTKRWRLWSGAGFSGDILLISDATFFDAVEAEAIRLAGVDIERAMEFAMDEWNYVVAETAPAQFTLTLVDMNDVALAASPGFFATSADAEAARERIIDHLYARYSMEGMYVVENLLLRPHVTNDPFLALPITDTTSEQDPYSQRLTVVLPSGYERDFGLVDVPRVESRPHRFRDPEFRHHAERVIRQSCPAHILPDIHWVDRRAPGTPAAHGAFEVFESRFHLWLVRRFNLGISQAATTSARRNLVRSINAIAAGA